MHPHGVDEGAALAPMLEGALEGPTRGAVRAIGAGVGSCAAPDWIALSCAASAPPSAGRARGSF